MKICCDHLTSGGVEQAAREIYETEYVGGDLKTHDGGSVVFFRDRFEHAFFRVEQVGNQKKSMIDKERVERTRWIPELIKGAIPDSECLSISEGTRPPNRLYILNSECYVAWLEPLRSGGWKFSSAYKAFGYQLKKYRASGIRIWKHGD